MEVLVTLKINDSKGKLLRKIEAVFCDETELTDLDEFIGKNGEEINDFLLSITEFDETDCGKAIIMRFYYVTLLDEEDAPDSEDELTADNERTILLCGNICAEDDLVNYIEA